MSEILLAIGLLAGILSSFRWLFNKVTHDTLGWYSALCYVFIPGACKRICNWGFSYFESIPQSVSTGVAISLWVFFSYLLLTAEHGATPKQAWIILLCWIPIIMLTVVGFLIANPNL